MRSNSFSKLSLAAALLLLVEALAPAGSFSQGDVRIGIKATTATKLPLLLAAFVGQGPVGNAPVDARGTVRRDFDLSGVYSVVDVEPLAGAPAPDPAQTDAIRVEGAVIASSGGGFTFVGRAIDVGSGETAFKREYAMNRATMRETMHRFVDDVLEALTGERGIAETKIAYVKHVGRIKEIWVMDYDGENQRQATHDGVLALSPAWAPWGSEFAFTTYKRGNPDLYLFDLARGASYPFSTRPGLNTAPAYSPDGKWIACTISRDGNSEIYRISRDGQTAKRLTRNEAIDTSPTWSPTGREIAFTSNRNGSAQIFVMDSDGLNQRLLTLEGSYNDSPQWSPRGDRFCYAARHDGVFDVIVMDANGANPVQLTQGAGQNENPRWSADGRKILFSSSRDGKRQLFMMNADGTDPVKLTNDAECFDPAWGPRPRKAAK